CSDIGSVEDVLHLLQAQSAPPAPAEPPVSDSMKFLVAAIQQAARSVDSTRAPPAKEKEEYKGRGQWYRNQQPRRTRPSPDTICHNCGQPGHLRKGCLLPPRPRDHQQPQQQQQPQQPARASPSTNTPAP